MNINFALLIACASVVADTHAPLRPAPLMRGNNLDDVVEFNNQLASAQLELKDDGIFTVLSSTQVSPSAVNVSVTWEGLTPADGDVLAIYCLQRESSGVLSSIGVADFISVSSLAAKGVEFTLPELSCDATELAYLQPGAEVYRRRAVTALPRAAAAGDDSTAPYHVRLAYGNSPGSVFFSWTSRANASIGRPQVRLVMTFKFGMGRDGGRVVVS